MKFGQVEHPEAIDFRLPADHPDTGRLLAAQGSANEFEVYVGCAKWNRQDLKGFYPKGVKDELAYYSGQFNAIELNATFYKSPDRAQVLTWKEKTPPDFRFFPKVPQTVSHFKRLVNAGEEVKAFCDAISNFEEKLGMSFLQMHDHFKPKDFARLEEFIKSYPASIPLAVEVRNAEWFRDREASEQLYALLEAEGRTQVIVDTAGRRDMLHMRLTSPTAFIRYVGANHSSDYSRLDDWLERILQWRGQGLKTLYFFVHQNVEKESPLLSAYFIQRLNQALGTDLKIPQTLESPELFKR